VAKSRRAKNEAIGEILKCRGQHYLQVGQTKSHREPREEKLTRVEGKEKLPEWGSRSSAGPFGTLNLLKVKEGKTTVDG